MNFVGRRLIHPCLVTMAIWGWCHCRIRCLLRWGRERSGSGEKTRREICGLRAKQYPISTMDLGSYGLGAIIYVDKDKNDCNMIGDLLCQDLVEWSKRCTCILFIHSIGKHHGSAIIMGTWISLVFLTFLLFLLLYFLCFSASHSPPPHPHSLQMKGHMNLSVFLTFSYWKLNMIQWSCIEQFIWSPVSFHFNFCFPFYRLKDPVDLH